MDMETIKNKWNVLLGKLNSENWPQIREQVQERIKRMRKRIGIAEEKEKKQDQQAKSRMDDESLPH